MNKRIAKKWAKHGGKHGQRLLRDIRRLSRWSGHCSERFLPGDSVPRVTGFISAYIAHYVEHQARLARFFGDTP